MALPTRVTLNV